MRIQDETRSHCPGRLQSILFDSHYCRSDPIMARTLGFQRFFLRSISTLGESFFILPSARFSNFPMEPLSPLNE
jgi:hypothetical protein